MSLDHAIVCPAVPPPPRAFGDRLPALTALWRPSGEGEWTGALASLHVLGSDAAAIAPATRARLEAKLGGPARYVLEVSGGPADEDGWTAVLDLAYVLAEDMGAVYVSTDDGRVLVGSSREQGAARGQDAPPTPPPSKTDVRPICEAACRGDARALATLAAWAREYRYGPTFKLTSPQMGERLALVGPLCEAIRAAPVLHPSIWEAVVALMGTKLLASGMTLAALRRLLPDVTREGEQKLLLRAEEERKAKESFARRSGAKKDYF